MPSTNWLEQIANDEDERFAGYAQGFAALQQKHSQKYGNGRALHRKQILALTGIFEVKDNLPDYARQGLFAKAATYKSWIRLSNGGPERVSDRRPDVRGFSFKVLGVQGPGALGFATESQDFALINQPAFAFPKSDEFVQLVLALSNGGGALLKHLVKRYGFIGAAKMVKKMAKTFGKPFQGFAVETFYSAAPIACGPYAVRVRLVPYQSDASPQGASLATDVVMRLEVASLRYDVQLQFFVDEQQTPIEDASVDWPESVAPYVSVATLTLPVQKADAQAAELTQTIEQSVFDPWCALAEHRPLGDVMRARKVVYFQSQKERGAA
jgi:hypothetical protein